MFVGGGEVSLINSKISDCYAEFYGGALYVDNSDQRYKVRVMGSTFTSCSANKVRYVERTRQLAQC